MADVSAGFAEDEKLVRPDSEQGIDPGGGTVPGIQKRAVDPGVRAGHVEVEIVVAAKSVPDICRRDASAGVRGELHEPREAQGGGVGGSCRSQAGQSAADGKQDGASH